MSELSHAVVIFSSFHCLSGFVLTLGVTPELDFEDGYKIETSGIDLTYFMNLKNKSFLAEEVPVPGSSSPSTESWTEKARTALEVFICQICCFLFKC